MNRALIPLPAFSAYRDSVDRPSYLLQDLLGPEECQKLIDMVHEDIRKVKAGE